MTFDKKIELQSFDVIRDDIGNETEAWKPLHRLWANSDDLFGAEYWAAAGQEQENTVVFTVRWFPALDKLIFAGDLTRYRIVYKGYCFGIKSFDNPQHRNLTVKIRAEKKGAVRDGE